MNTVMQKKKQAQTAKENKQFKIHDQLNIYFPFNPWIFLPRAISR